MEMCAQQGPSLPDQVKAIALSPIRSNALGNLQDCSATLACVSTTVMEEIVQDEKTTMGEVQLFELLQSWIEAVNTDAAKDATTQVDADSTLPCNKRKSIAMDLIRKHIHLDHIDPTILSDSVASSGLVTLEQLAETYKKQALALKKKHGFPSQKPRLIPVWSTSHSDTSVANGSGKMHDVLNYQPMSSGIHQWTLELKTSGNDLELGITCSTKPIDISKAFTSQVFCLYYPSGWVVHAEGKDWATKKMPRFALESSITFTLDLSPEQEANGTLAASANGIPSVILVSNLRNALDYHLGGGFLPVIAAVHENARVRLANIERLKVVEGKGSNNTIS